jgi:hypothetical protein
MHKAIAKPLREIISLLKIETINLKKISDKQFKNFCEIFNIDGVDDDIYLNGSVIVFSNPEIFEAIQYTLDEDSIVARIEVTEYNISLYIVRWLKEYMIKEALDLHDLISQPIIIESEDDLS